MIDRRLFLQYTGAGAAVLALPAAAGKTTEAMPTRPIPGTGEALPVIGLGNSGVFQQGDLAQSRELLDILTSHGGSYVDTLGASRETLGRILFEDDIRDELFVGTYLDAGDYASGRLEIDSLREVQGGGALDLVQTADMEDLARRWTFISQYKDEGLARYSGLAKSGQQYFERIMQLMASETIDFVQVNYSLLEPQAADRLLPLAQDKGIAVVINRPFLNGRYFTLVRDRTLPDWAAEFDCNSWAQFSLKFILAHPAVNCVLTETTNPEHAEDNFSAGSGRLPDKKMQTRMLELMKTFV